MYINAIARKECAFKDYVDDIPAIAKLSVLELNAPVTFFIGENGSGKSTLIEAIAINYGFNPEGGTKNFNYSTFVSHSELHNSIVLHKGVKRPKDGFYLRAESFYNFATEVNRLDEGTNTLIGSYGGKSLHAQSHGESFISLVANRFGGRGLYILDEPEAALSPTRQLSLLTLIHDLVADDSQFIIATHSPLLMAYPGAEILELSDNGITLKNYVETEHYTVYRNFLENPQRMLELLFQE